MEAVEQLDLKKPFVMILHSLSDFLSVKTPYYWAYRIEGETDEEILRLRHINKPDRADRYDDINDEIAVSRYIAAGSYLDFHPVASIDAIVADILGKVSSDPNIGVIGI